jgi:hypothetical protein
MPEVQSALIQLEEISMTPSGGPSPLFVMFVSFLPGQSRVLRLFLSTPQSAQRSGRRLLDGKSA